jgi:thioredoxin reductase
MISYDAIVVGGSFAGLSAALMLARTRRRILVLDAGLPRNRFAAHSHGVLAQDGRAGSEILASARAQLAAYPNTAFVTATVQSAAGWNGDFVVGDADGRAYRGRKLLLAGGVTDTLPDVPGLAERWGTSVLHCPYCHGYEIGGGAIGVLASGPTAAHHAALIADWGDVTLFTHGEPAPDDEHAPLLQRRRIAVETAAIAAVEGRGTALEQVLLRDGRRIGIRALFVAVSTQPAGTLASQLGCDVDTVPAGRILRTDAQKATTVAGVYAAGDAALARTNITLAAADGVMAAVSLHQSLIADEIAA